MAEVGSWPGHYFTDSGRIKMIIVSGPTRSTQMQPPTLGPASYRSLPARPWAGGPLITEQINRSRRAQVV
jgi:hypothetical protein